MLCLSTRQRQTFCRRSRPASLPIIISVLAAMLLYAVPSRAQVPLMQFSNGQTAPAYFRNGGVFGFEIRLLVPYLIHGLGIWDEDADGLASSHEVGLWDQSGTTLLASTLLDNGASPLATPEAAAQGGRWLKADIAPLLLAPGRYVVGAAYQPGDLDTIWFTSSGLLPSSSDVIFVVARELAPGSGLMFPEVPIELGGYFGPTVFGTAQVAAPEPSSFALTGGLFFGWLLRRRIRRGTSLIPAPLRRADI
jgi:hypothetical protein